MTRKIHAARRSLSPHHAVVPISALPLLLLSLGISPAVAQGAPGQTGPAPSGAAQAFMSAPALADTLAGARPPESGVALAVGAPDVPLPPGALLPGVRPTVAEVADAYGRITLRFGSVTAIAPPTMTVLNTETTPVDPYDGIAPADAFKLLCGSLDDAQWGLLTGSQGLGAGDLSDAQRPLFEALFAHSTVEVWFLHSRDTNSLIHAPWTRLSEDAVQQLRLRLAQRLSIQVPTGKNGNVGVSNFGLDLGQKLPMGDVRVWAGKPNQTLQGVTLRAVVPNAPKPSGLDFHNPALVVPVGLDDVKTVGALITRIGQATHLELYADRRYEKRTITTLGTAPAAGDLLRALALCVCGTYRQVGPAYVLTNDQVGLAPRRLTADRLVAAGAAGRQAAEEAAADRLISQRGGVLGLPGAQGEELTAQEQAFTPPDMPKTALSPEFPAVTVPWSLLTPPQQEIAEFEFKAVNMATRDPRRSPNWVAEGKQNGLFVLSADDTLSLLSPSFPVPLELPNGFTDGLFSPSPTLKKTLTTQNKSILERFYKPSPPIPVADLAARLATLPRRAVFARPRTGAELDALLGAMKRLSLNQLWLDVFSQGTVHMDGSHDLLTEALAKVNGTGITVVPSLELLDWGPDAPDDARDRNIFGEAPVQPNGGLPASPAEPTVQDGLTRLIQRLAATPGVSAIAIHHTVSLEQRPNPGKVTFIGQRGPMLGSPDSPRFGRQDAPIGKAFWTQDLGYVPPLRLEFLRRWHLDPLDLPKSPDMDLNVDVSVPEFDAPQAMNGMDQAWSACRSAATMGLMQRLLAVAQQSAGRRFPFLVHTLIDGSSDQGYALWDDPRTSLPLLGPRQTQPLSDEPLSPPQPLAHLKLYETRSYDTVDRRSLADKVVELGHAWDGIVLELGDAPGGSALAGLAPSLRPARAKAAGH